MDGYTSCDEIRDPDITTYFISVPDTETNEVI